MRLLLVDDDVELAEMLKEYLLTEGFEVALAHEGSSGLALALSGQFAMVVLDVMMPGTSGIEVLARIRLQSRIPVLMLTAKGDDLDRIMGLELGADDYVPKPCTPRELVARIRAILRRTQPASPGSSEPITVGLLTVNPAKRTALWKDQALDLTSTEFNLLETLARHAGRVVSKAELSEAALGRPLARYDRSIDVHISSLRQKLGLTCAEQEFLLTVRGKGYQLAGE